MENLPDDLLIAYQNFTLLATKHGFAFAGMMTRILPDPAIVAIGNVTEKGFELADLLRKYAEIIDEKTDRGLFKTPVFQKTN